MIRKQSFFCSVVAAVLGGVVSCAAFAAPPGWWTEPATRILAPDTAPDNYAPANLGQLKHVASQAKKHLDQTLAAVGGAGPAINDLVASFEPRAGQNYTPGQLAAFREANHAPANLGQLKAVAKPFYDRLIAVGVLTNAGLRGHGYPEYWPHAYPWNPEDPWNQPAPPGQQVDKTVNLAPANLGQLKLTFSFDAGQDADGDAIPDWWESAHGLLAWDWSDATEDADGDGWTNLQEWVNGGDPQNQFPAAQVLGDGAQGQRISQQKTVTLPAGNQSYIVIVVVATAEYPEFTWDPANPYDDLADWNISPSGGTPIQGSIHVNPLHSTFQQSDQAETSCLGLSPYALAAQGIIHADPNAPTQVLIEVAATNISDGAYPTTIIAALLPVEITKLWSDQIRDGASEVTDANYLPNKTGQGDKAYLLMGAAQSSSFDLLRLA